MNVTQRDQHLAALEITMLECLRMAQPTEAGVLTEDTESAITVAYAAVAADRATSWLTEDDGHDSDAPLPSAHDVVTNGVVQRGSLARD